MKMTAKKLHKLCCEAVAQCPQRARSADWKFSQKPFGTKYETLEDVARYWLSEKILWESGYQDALAPEAIEFFNSLFDALRVGMTAYCLNQGESLPRGEIGPRGEF